MGNTYNIANTCFSVISTLSASCRVQVMCLYTVVEERLTGSQWW